MAASTLPDGLTPDSVDTITELNAILVKLRATQAAASSIANPSTNLLGTLPGATPAPGAVTGTTPLPSGAPNTSGGTTTLNIKELPAATDNLKHKLQRARAALKQLPDISRTIAQQKEEIKELEARRLRQLQELARIKGEGLQFSLGEQKKGEDGERMVVE